MNTCYRKYKEKWKGSRVDRKQKSKTDAIIVKTVRDKPHIPQNK